MHVIRITALCLLLASALPAAGPPPQTGVAVLLEDNAAELLPKLTNPGGDPGAGHVEKSVVFSGVSAVRIVPMQRYHHIIPGWAYRITGKPREGEYRFLRFAWKADGCDGVMIQLHTTDWKIRYTAGIDQPRWGSRFVAGRAPSEWAVYTVDLFKDFGEVTITGMALTAFGGKSAYFDHIYFGRTVDDLDRIDATGFRTGRPVRFAAGEMGTLWSALGGPDAPVEYRSFWKLVAGPDDAAPFLARKLAASGPALATVRRWVRELEDDEFDTREAAERRLRDHLNDAGPLLEELAKAGSPEAKRRARRLLEGRGGLDVSAGRITMGVRALEYMNTPAARKALKTVASEAAGSRAGLAAKAALERMDGGTR
jgi:hypothetical protein